MRDQRTKVPKKIRRFYIRRGHQYMPPSLKDDILIFFPGREIRRKRNEKKDRQQKKAKRTERDRQEKSGSDPFCSRQRR